MGVVILREKKKKFGRIQDFSKGVSKEKAMYKLC